MNLTKMIVGVALVLLAAGAGAAATNAELKKQVADTERAFAATMKARDHVGFASFLVDPSERVLSCQTWPQRAGRCSALKA